MSTERRQHPREQIADDDERTYEQAKAASRTAAQRIAAAGESLVNAMRTCSDACEAAKKAEQAA